MVNKRRTNIPLQDGYRFVADGGDRQSVRRHEPSGRPRDIKYDPALRLVGSESHDRNMIGWPTLKREIQIFEFHLILTSEADGIIYDLKPEAKAPCSSRTECGSWRSKQQAPYRYGLTNLLSQEDIYKTSFSKYGYEYKNYISEYKEEYHYA